MELMTAMAVLPDGTPVGPCGQSRWVRPTGPKKKLSKKAREKWPVEDKETRFWLNVMAQAREVFTAEAPATRLWLQLDRGADAWPVLLQAVDGSADVTIRAAQDRLLEGTIDGRSTRLWESCRARSLVPRTSLTSRRDPTGPAGRRRCNCSTHR